MSRTGPNVPLLLGGLAFTIGFVVLLGVGFLFNPFALPDNMTGRPAPDFRLTDLDGNEVQLSDHLGRPVVLNFWSTWCIPCKQEHPVLLEAAKLYPEVTFLGVVYLDQPGPIRNYLKRAGSAYPHLIDPGSRVAIDYGVTGVPESFFIDRKGVIQNKVAFPVSASFLGTQLEPLLAGSTP